MSDTEKILAAVGIVALAVIVAVALPFAYIWSWNHLFGDIKTFDYSFWNWLAVSVFGTFLRGIRIERKKS